MDILSDVVMGKPLWMWGSFLVLVFSLLAFDLLVLHRKSHEISIKESMWTSLFYISVALLFGAWVWYSLGPTSGKEYLTGYIVEQTLSMDNLFIISLVFSYFHIPRQYQHRVLFWGILGVVVLRGVMIGLGAALVSEFSWVLHIFAVFLIYTGVKMLFMGDELPDIENNFILRFLKKRIRITNELHGEKFIVKMPHPRTGKIKSFATPLLVALVLIEFVDLIFAVDSVPAIFTITLDPYIVYTSNIFAILGLRSMYFALSVIIHRFKYLKPALACVLIFIGSKGFISHFMGWTKFPAGISLSVTLGLIAAGILVSIYKTKNSTPETKA